jgi:hypothetical protein
MIVLVLIFLLSASSPASETFNESSPVLVRQVASFFPVSPPQIDGKISPGEWDDAAQIQSGDSMLYIQNDAAYLYLMDDAARDTKTVGAADNNFNRISTVVVVDHAGVRMAPFHFVFNVRAIGVEACEGPADSPVPELSCGQPQLQAAVGFGPTLNSNIPHRYWEIAISLPEINAIPADTLQLGLDDSAVQNEIGNRVSISHSAHSYHFLNIVLAKPQFQLLVLAHQDFLDVLQPLKIHKEKTGLPAYVQSWQSVARSFYSQGHDVAERIKRAIAAYDLYDGVRYVMLVGDAAHFPVRYAITEHDNENSRSGWTFIPTDYYYADLFKRGGGINTWDGNQDGYFGELDTQAGTTALNIDEVGITPTVAVGRIPASNSAEVAVYVKKVIQYEFNAYRASWAKRAVFLSTTDWVPPACQIANKIASTELEPGGYQVSKLYEDGYPCIETAQPSSDKILKMLNQGVGFASYFGHGSNDGWSIPGDAFTTRNLAGLTNTERLSIIFTAGCNTAQFGALLPQAPYVDTQGVIQASWTVIKGISFKPRQPAEIQPDKAAASFAEQLLVKRNTGAVGYLGAVSSSQYPAYDLARSFFGSLSSGIETLGDMWKTMVVQYYRTHSPADARDAPAWYRAALFQQPWKFNLLGDPSLRIRGVPGLSTNKKP